MYGAFTSVYINVKYFLTGILQGAEKVNSCSAIQEITSILWGLKVYYHVHNIPPVISVLKQINSVHTLKSYFFKIHFIFSSPVHLGLSSDNFRFYLPEFCIHLSSLMRATSPAHPSGSGTAFIESRFAPEAQLAVHTFRAHALRFLQPVTSV
jgi:hypothetical protein